MHSNDFDFVLEFEGPDLRLIKTQILDLDRKTKILNNCGKHTVGAVGSSKRPRNWRNGSIALVIDLGELDIDELDKSKKSDGNDIFEEPMIKSTKAKL